MIKPTLNLAKLNELVLAMYGDKAYNVVYNYHYGGSPRFQQRGLVGSMATCGVGEIQNLLTYKDTASQYLVDAILTALATKRGLVLYFKPVGHSRHLDPILDSFGFKVKQTFINPNTGNELEQWEVILPPWREI